LKGRNKAIAPYKLTNKTAPTKRRGSEAPLLFYLFRSSMDQGATSVPIRLGAWPTGMTAISFIATVSIAVTALRAALEM
jgi:hypothetical protein